MTEQKKVPGQDRRLRARIVWGCGLVLAILMVIAAVVVGSAAATQGQRQAWGCLGLSGAAFVLLIGAIGERYGSAFDHLAESWQDLYLRLGAEQENHKVARGHLDSAAGFLKVYRPPQEQVDEVLTKAAKHLEKAFAEELAVYETGVGCHVSHAPAHDVEERTVGDRDLFRNWQESTARRVKEAKDEFWRLWHLAEAQGYTLKKSWKPYAGLEWHPAPPKEASGFWPVGQEPKS